MCDTTPQVLERARFRGGRRDAGTGQRSSGPGDGLFARLQRRRVRAHVQDADRRLGDRCGRTSDHRVSHAARRRYSERHHADERGRRDRSGTTTSAANPGRSVYTRTLTDGTVGTFDHEDAHTVNVMPRLYAEKAAALQVDRMSPGIVDAGDVLRYTIRIYNNGCCRSRRPCCATSVPANTTYVADSMTLNGQPVRPARRRRVAARRGRRRELVEPDAAVAGSGAGMLSAGQMAVVPFDLRVNDGVPPGTVIANQAVVDTAELPKLLDRRRRQSRDGARADRRRRRQPAAARITKNVAVVGGGPALAGATLEYVVQATNSRHRAGLCRRDPRRHRGADAGVSHVRRSGRGR